MCCAPTAAIVLEPKPELLPIDNSYSYDSLAEATIAPFREQMEKEYGDGYWSCTQEVS